MNVIDYSKQFKTVNFLGSYFMIVNKENGMVLNVSSNGKVMLQNEPNQTVIEISGYSQLWFWDGAYLRSKVAEVNHKKKVLGCSGNQAVYKELQNTGNNQKWYMKNGKLVNKGTEYVLDVSKDDNQVICGKGVSTSSFISTNLNSPFWFFENVESIG